MTVLDIVVGDCLYVHLLHVRITKGCLNHKTKQHTFVHIIHQDQPNNNWQVSITEGK